MTVKELKEILDGIDENTRVCYQTYSNTEINGWFFSKKDSYETLVLTDLNVQPR